MLVPEAQGDRQEQEFIQVRAFRGQESGVPGREAEPPAGKKSFSVQNTSSIVSFRQTAVSCSSSGQVHSPLSEEETLRVYGKRWDVEVFFKTCKSMLNLGSECHSLSYDALTAHVSLVFIRYMLLSLQQRNNSDDRTISELFLLMIDELADITFGHALQLILDMMLQMIQERFGLADDQLDEIVSEFIARLPFSYQHALHLKAA